MDPKLGRVIEVWKTSHVETVRDALLRYGIDQVDKVVEQVRGRPGWLAGWLAGRRQPHRLALLVDAGCSKHGR